MASFTDKFGIHQQRFCYLLYHLLTYLLLNTLLWDYIWLLRHEIHYILMTDLYVIILKKMSQKPNEHQFWHSTFHIFINVFRRFVFPEADYCFKFCTDIIFLIFPRSLLIGMSRRVSYETYDVLFHLILQSIQISTFI